MLQATDFQKLAAELGQWQTWAVLGAVAVAGLLGGLARKLTAAPSDAATSKADPVVGAITALAMLMIVPAQQLASLIGLSIVSGFAGKSLLDALRARAEALAAKQQAAEAQQAARQADEKRKEAVEKGLAVVQKAREIAAAGDSVTTHLADSLTPAVRDSLSKSSRFFIRTAVEPGAPMSISAAASNELVSLEEDLRSLL